ncbi:MAG: hypothetical protein ABGZ35_08670 [Planctomycetaceae bacterium]
MSTAIRDHAFRFASVGLLCLTVYFVSFGPVFSYWVSRPYSSSGSNATLRFYRPLFKAAPYGLMQKYSEACGLTDIEAFYLVQALKSDQPLEGDPRFDES